MGSELERPQAGGLITALGTGRRHALMDTLIREFPIRYLSKELFSSILVTQEYACWLIGSELNRCHFLTLARKCMHVFSLTSILFHDS
jgi:hypothetical protein